MNQAPPAPRISKAGFAAVAKCFFAASFMTLLIFVAGARAESADDQYLRVIALVDRADLLNEKKTEDSGKAKYLEAATAMQSLRKQYPTWNTKVLSYRMNYVLGKINVLSQTNTVEVVTGDKPGAKPEAKSGAGQVKLLASGLEPRKVLRLQPKAGDKQSVMMSLKMSMDMGVAGAMKMPAMNLPMIVTVKSVSSEGDITYETVTGESTLADDPASDPAMAAGLKASMGNLGGLTNTGTLSNRGLSKASAVTLPPDANPQMRQTLEQLKDSLANAMMLLPEEAVGPGAKWEIKQVVKSQGMNIHQTVHYQLVSADGDRLTLKNVIAQNAPKQKIESPAMPGMKLDLTKMTGTGTGNISLDLTKLLPTSATTDLHTEISMGLNLGGQAQSVNMKMDVNTVLESK